MNLLIKRITIFIFTLSLSTNKCFTKNFYVKNKTNSCIMVEIIYTEKDIIKKFVYSNEKITICPKTYMPIYGKYRGKIITEEVESINIYPCKITDDYFDYKIIVPLEKIISIQNNLKTPSIEYLNKKNEEPIYYSYPLGISYEE
ncbi:MAG: hypothetical protein ABIF12_03555 [bacterium]